MNLLKQIQNNLSDRKIADIVIELGYKSSKSAKVTQVLTELLNITELDEYMDKSYYDFKYDSKTLLQAICEIADISKFDYAKTIEEYQDEKCRLEAMYIPYIFINTNFKRKNEPIFALAIMESRRRIQLDKKMYLEKNEDELNTYISNVVKLHYKWENGKLPLWGDIKAYIYYDIKGNRTVYSPLGNIIETEAIQETRACVTLKNRHLFGVQKDKKH